MTLIALSLGLAVLPGPAIAAAPAREAALAPAVLGQRTLHMGLRGRDVALLQRELTAAGFATPATGYFGSITAHHVAQFKRAQGLTPADGMFRIRDVIPLYETVTASTAGGAAALNVPNPEAVAAPAPAQPLPLAPGDKAKLLRDGLAEAPADAPVPIQEMIAAGNKIAKLPYCYGGGHGSWKDSCYDCSGSVSYVLHAGGLLSTTADSGEMETYGLAGLGHWITLYTNAGHVFMYVAGLRYDTVALQESGSRWANTTISTDGFIARHPAGW